MAEEHFIELELEIDITVDESDLSGYTNHGSTELILIDIMTDQEICLINKSEEIPVLESIPTTETGEIEIAFVEESMVKKMTIDDESKATESSKRKKYHCERCGMTYVRGGFVRNIFLVGKWNSFVFSLAWLVWLHT